MKKFLISFEEVNLEKGLIFDQEKRFVENPNALHVSTLKIKADSLNINLISTENNKTIPILTTHENKMSQEEKTHLASASPAYQSSSFNKIILKFNKNIHEDNDNKNSIFLEILICDDDSYIIKSYKNLFKKLTTTNNNLRIQIEECSGGVECFNKIVERSISGQNPYDFILIDDEMKYLNGSELYKILEFIIKAN